MKINALLAIVTLIIMTSCAGLTQVTVPCSPVNMGDRDIETERKVSYTLTKTYFLGIGGLSERARNTDIIEQLFRKANLKKNEALAYISVAENINCYLGIIVIAKFTATGYVVRPVGEEYADQQTIEEKDGVLFIESTPINQEPPKDNSYISKECERLIKAAQKYVEYKESRNIRIEAKRLLDAGTISEEEYKKIRKALNERFSQLDRAARGYY